MPDPFRHLFLKDSVEREAMVLQKFCPKCGKDVEKLFQGRCKECFMGHVRLAHVPETMHIALCPCTRSLEHGAKGWKQYETFEAMINGVIRNNAKILESDVELDISYTLTTVTKKMKLPVTITAKKEIEGEILEEPHKAFIVIRAEHCDMCNRQLGNYYEAIVQIRGEETEREKIYLFVKDLIAREAQKNPALFVTKEEKLREGHDIYLGSQKIGKKLMKLTSESFNVELKESHRLFGVVEGVKDVTRATFLIRAKENNE